MKPVLSIQHVWGKSRYNKIGLGTPAGLRCIAFRKNSQEMQKTSDRPKVTTLRSSSPCWNGLVGRTVRRCKPLG